MNRMRSGFLLATAVLLSSSAAAERYQVNEDSFGSIRAERVTADAPAVSHTTPSVDMDEADRGAEPAKPAKTPPDPAVVSPNPRPSSEVTQQQQVDAAGSNQVVDERELHQIEEMPIEPEFASQPRLRIQPVTRVGAPVSGINRPEAPEAPNTGPSATPIVEGAIPQNTTEPTPEPTPEPSPKRKLSVFERVYLENEVADQEKAQQLRRQWQGGERVDATEVNEADYVDGDAVLDGRFTSDGKQPFSVTYDSEGRAIVNFVDAEQVAAELDAQQESDQTLYTEATEYRVSEETERAEMLAGAESAALRILGVAEQSYFGRYADSCCTQLPHAKIPVLEPGRAHFFKLTKDDAPFRFEDGDSRYLLIKLPSSRRNYPLRVRSFIRKFEKQDIAHGVFLPQLVLLNEMKEPVRIIAEPVLRFEEENWLKYGYLEGTFLIEQDPNDAIDERFLVVNTTFASRTRVTRVETEEEIIDIVHMPTGSFEIQIVVD